MPALTFEQIRERLAIRFADAVGPTVAAKDPFVVVKADSILEVCRFLHDDPELAFDYLVDETAVDHPAEKLVRVVYHLWSIPQKHAFKLKVECDRENPRLPSVVSVWAGANWLEREVLDLFGVTFEGHPDPRRLMMPEDWQGHPMRKDWQEFGGYHGIGNTRESPLDLHLEHDKKLRAEAAKNAPPAPAPVAAAPAAKPAAPVRSEPVEGVAAKPAPAAPAPEAKAPAADPKGPSTAASASSASAQDERKAPAPEAKAPEAKAAEADPKGPSTAASASSASAQDERKAPAAEAKAPEAKAPEAPAQDKPASDKV